MVIVVIDLRVAEVIKVLPILYLSYHTEPHITDEDSE